MRLGLWGTMLAIAAFVLPLSVGASVARGNGNPVVVLQFAPAISPLSQAEMPVYLPTWLPSLPTNVRTITSVSTQPSATDTQSVVAQYQASLAVNGQAGCRQCELITVVGQNGPLGHAAGARHLRLFGPVYAYFWNNAQGSWMSWRIGNDFYRLRCALLSNSGQSTTPCSVATYKKVVMSVVRVN